MRHRGAAVLSGVALACLAACTRGGAGGEAAHAHGGPPAAEGLPAQAVTRWTDRAELFLEYEPPVAGREGRFAAHLTALPAFKAVTQGSMTLTLAVEGGERLTAVAGAPTSPGIFRALLRPTRAGKCALTVAVHGPQAEDVIDAGPCEVFADEAAARRAAGAEAAGDGIGFTKEQQWKTDFATAAAAERELQPTAPANGEIRPVAGGEARLSAAATGRVTLATPAPVLGMPVKAGQVLASIAPRLSAGGDRATLLAEVQVAQAELLAAEAQWARAERLGKEQAVPQRAVDEARARSEVARARLGAAQGRLEQYTAGAQGLGAGGPGAFQVRSPIEGTLVAAAVASGESVEEGRLLFTVIDLRRVWVEARVFEPDIPRVEGARAAWFSIEGYEAPFVVDERTGRLVTVGRVIDPRSRTVPVIFEVENPDGRLRIGQFAKVSIATGAPVRGVAVPAAAILDDGGKPVVWVQVEGESFERRRVVPGAKSPGWVEVREGVAAGERVVTRGAYELKLSAASGAIPQHGHVH